MGLLLCLLLSHAGRRQPPNTLRQSRICFHELERLKYCERIPYQYRVSHPATQFFDGRKRTVLRGWIDQFVVLYGVVREACEPNEVGEVAKHKW